MFNISETENGSLLLEKELLSLASDTPAPRHTALNIANGEIVITILPVKIGELPEKSSLVKKLRPHFSADGESAELEMEHLIPFGEEPSVIRKCHLENEYMLLSTDLRMRSSCRVGWIDGGGLRLEGPFRKIFFPGSGKEEVDFAKLEDGAVFYEEPLPPLFLTFETKKSLAEFAVGDDFWRWCNAERFQGKSTFTLKKEGENSLLFSWELYKADPDLEEIPPGRNHRFSALFGWKFKRAEKRKLPKIHETLDMDCIQWPESACQVDSSGNIRSNTPCFASSPVEKILKKWVRSRLENLPEGSVLALKNVEPFLCTRGAHMERPKVQLLPHNSLVALLDFRSWANRLLANKDCSLILIARENSPLKGKMGIY